MSRKPKKFADFYIWPKTTSPHDITQRLGIQPSKCCVKGEEYDGFCWDPTNRQKTNRISIHSKSLWQISTKGVLESEQISDHAIYLLKQLEPVKTIIQEVLNDKDEYFIRFCFWNETLDGHMSISIPSPEMIRLSQLCHEVYFTFISYECDDDKAISNSVITSPE